MPLSGVARAWKVNANLVKLIWRQPLNRDMKPTADRSSSDFGRSKAAEELRALYGQYGDKKIVLFNLKELQSIQFKQERLFLIIHLLCRLL